MTKISFVKFDPFSIACYDPNDKKIYVDSAFRKAPFLGVILNHETKHQESKKAVDINIDFNETSLRPFYLKILKKKPLWLFSSLFPFIGIKRKKWDWGIDYSRLISLSFFIILLIAIILIF